MVVWKKMDVLGRCTLVVKYGRRNLEIFIDPRKTLMIKHLDEYKVNLLIKYFVLGLV